MHESSSKELCTSTPAEQTPSWKRRGKLRVLGWFGDRSLTGWSHSSAGSIVTDSPPRYSDETKRLIDRVLQADRDEQCSQWTIKETNTFRRYWHMLMIPVLIYIGTLMPQRLAFIEFHVVHNYDVRIWWRIANAVIELIFIVDLILGFFFTYRDILEQEVVSLRKIIRHYLRTSFLISLIACFPPDLVEWLFPQWTHADTQASSGKSQMHKGVRFLKFLRISRILRLLRLFRMCTILDGSSMWRQFRKKRGVRVVRFVVTFTWVVHLTACALYMCAALHDDVETTWPFRYFDPEALRIADTGPVLSWLYSFYFALTAITTVGFGDISPETNGEILLVCIVLCAGTAANGVVTAEIIATVSKAGIKREHIVQQEHLVEEFSQQTQMKDQAENWLKQWVFSGRATHQAQDKENMVQLLIGGTFPREILGKLPAELFRGRLIKNRIITLLEQAGHQDWPMQLPLLISIHGSMRKYDAGEIVYYASDHPWSVFLILKGIFAHVTTIFRKGTNIGSERGLDSPIHTTGEIHHGRSGDLHPCSILGFGNYFGEEEILLKRQQRRSTVRCESPAGGELLMLEREDFDRLAREFPDMAHLWLQNALRREQSRVKAVRALRHDPVDYISIVDLAACAIQRSIRRHVSHLARAKTIASNKTSASKTVQRFKTGATAVFMQAALKKNVSGNLQLSSDGETFSRLSAEVSSLKTAMSLLLESQRELQASVDELAETYSPFPTIALPAELTGIAPEDVMVYCCS